MKRYLPTIGFLLLSLSAGFASAQTVNFDNLTSPAVGVGSQHPAYTQFGFSIIRIPDPLDPASNSIHFHTTAGNGTPGFPNTTAAEFFSDDGAPVLYFFGPVLGTNANNYTPGTESPFNLLSINVLDVAGQFTLTSAFGATQVIDHPGIYTFGAGFAGVLEFRHDYTDTIDGDMVIDDIIFKPTTYRTVSGRILLDGASVPPSSVAIDFRAPGTTDALFTRTVTPDGTGSYTLSNIPNTVYDLAFRGGNTLRYVAAGVDTTAGNVTSLNVALPPGDADGNNSVDVGDFGLFVNAYGSAQSDPNSTYDPQADFNGDGLVDTGDFGLLVNSFGLTGDN